MIVKLEDVAGDGVIWVVLDRVKVLQTRAPPRAVGYANILRQTVVTIVGRVVQARALQTPENVVEGTVLKQDPDYVLDLFLQVRNGLGGAGLVTKGRINNGLLVRAGSQRTSESHEAGENGSVDLHCGKPGTKGMVPECLTSDDSDERLGTTRGGVLILRAGMKGLHVSYAQG